MSLESSQLSIASEQLDSLLLALSTLDTDGDGEIDWKDFSTFCEQQQISVPQQKQIWKQLGGESDEDSKILPQQIESKDIENRHNEDSDHVFQSQDDEEETDQENEEKKNNSAEQQRPSHVEQDNENDGDEEDNDEEQDEDDDDDEKDDDELILELEISDIMNHLNESYVSPKIHALSKSIHNGLTDIKALFAKFDTERKGILSQSQFILLVKQLYPHMAENDICALFKLLDKHNDEQFVYDEADNVQTLQQRLNSYPKNMLSSFEFCNELRKIYCTKPSTHSNDNGSNDTNTDLGSEYTEDDPVSSAYTLKKQMDYALSASQSNDRLLSLCCQDLWKWISEYGVSSIHSNQTLNQQISKMTLKNEALHTEMETLEQRMKELESELSQSKHDKHHLSESCDSLQCELQQMAIQLSQEQCLSDSNSKEIETLKSYHRKSHSGSSKILIESGSKVYAQQIEMNADDERQFVDTIANVDIDAAGYRRSKHRRDQSYDLPNETLLIGHLKSQPATTDEDEVDAAISNEEAEEDEEEDDDKEQETPPVHRRETVHVVDVLPRALTANVHGMEQDASLLHEIQTSLDEQHGKLNTIIELIKSLDSMHVHGGNKESLQQNLNVIKQSLARMMQDRENKNSYSKQAAIDESRSVGVGMRKLVPFLVMGIVCLAGYTTYRHQKRK